MFEVSDQLKSNIFCSKSKKKVKLNTIQSQCKYYRSDCSESVAQGFLFIYFDLFDISFLK